MDFKISTKFKYIYDVYGVIHMNLWIISCVHSFNKLEKLEIISSCSVVVVMSSQYMLVPPTPQSIKLNVQLSFFFF